MIGLPSFATRSACSPILGYRHGHRVLRKGTPPKVSTQVWTHCRPLPFSKDQETFLVFRLRTFFSVKPPPLLPDERLVKMRRARKSEIDVDVSATPYQARAYLVSSVAVPCPLPASFPGTSATSSSSPPSCRMMHQICKNISIKSPSITCGRISSAITCVEVLGEQIAQWPRVQKKAQPTSITVGVWYFDLVPHRISLSPVVFSHSIAPRLAERRPVRSMQIVINVVGASRGLF